jgi:hypothetical protein
MKKGDPKTASSQHSGNSTTVQRQRLVEALRARVPIARITIQIREQLDIVMPAARVHKLRWELGYKVQAVPSRDCNPQGNHHKCKRYVLLSGTWVKAGVVE